MSTEAFVRNESAREELWLDLVESSLSMTEKKYKRVHEEYIVIFYCTHFSINLRPATFRDAFRLVGEVLYDVC